jgi:Acetyltransferase (GNAT) domain
LRRHATGAASRCPIGSTRSERFADRSFSQGARRPNFQTDGGFSDPDTADLYAYHIVAYDGSRLVGSIRVYRLTDNGPACVTESILGEKSFSGLLHQRGVQRTDAVAIGRWVVHPAYRANGRVGAQLAAAAAATLATGLGNGSVARQGMVVCSVGTGDQQDMMLGRIGLTAVPVTQPIKCDDFDDDIRVMHCIGTDQLNPWFHRFMEEIAKTLGRTPDLRSAANSP